MEWRIIYLRGRRGFSEIVSQRLAHSSLVYMPGELGAGGDPDGGSALYWLDKRDDLRAFKKAIGSKIIFKYRLRFFESFESYIEAGQGSPKTLTDKNEDWELTGVLER